MEMIIDENEQEVGEGVEGVFMSWFPGPAVLPGTSMLAAGPNGLLQITMPLPRMSVVLLFLIPSVWIPASIQLPKSLKRPLRLLCLPDLSHSEETEDMRGARSYLFPTQKEGR